VSDSTRSPAARTRQHSGTNLDLGRQRAVFTALCTVTFGPAMHGWLPGGAYLDTSPRAIQFTWHQ
jgi:hypothetical protein